MDARSSPQRPPPAWGARAACLAGALACGSAWAQVMAPSPGGLGTQAAPRSPAAPVRPVQLPQGGMMLERTDMALAMPGMPTAAASAPTARPGLAGSRLAAGMMVLQPANAAPASPAVPAERLAQRVGAAGQLVLVRTDDTAAPSAAPGTAPASQRRVVVLRRGKAPGAPEPDVLYRAP
ncbi:hypothetical protein [Roseateles sp.]|uniref:hypothetical protein n=1 Tax=Roseateles sp. TaxID=1971397 RepID=UPI0025F6A54A|nr:hypothetical protein [Roseateles sp.]MBV8037121.1 hypothetical protein [Roseateles sp.]